MRKIFIVGLFIIIISIFFVNIYFYNSTEEAIEFSERSQDIYKKIHNNMYQISMHISESEYSLRNLYLSRDERNSLAIIKIIEANRVVDDMFLVKKINLNVYGMLTQLKDNLKNYEKILDKYSDPNIQRDEILDREAVLQDINKLLVSINYTVDQDLEKHQNNINIVLVYHKMFIMGLPLIVVVFLILFLVFVFNKIISPINSIVLAMQKVVEGEYKQISETDGLFEIRELIDFYNKLIDHVKLLLEKEIFDKNEIKKQEMAIEVIHEKLEKKISEFSEILNYASHGDLTLKAQIQDNDEIARLGEGFNRMLLNLSALIRQVKSTSIEVSKSATEIVITTEDMTKGATEQSSQISEVSAALEELSIAARQISENTLVMLDSTKNALYSVQEGKNLMSETITSIQQMRKIAEFTARRILELGNKIQKIEEITKIINEISEQTNLLALNAAIEATKAGEHGKGFAVVADEVSKLAENSSHSANEIKNLIRDIQLATNATVLSMEEETKSSEIGEKHALLMGKTFENIEQAIQNSTLKTKEISLATQQQKIGSEQATRAMENIVDISHRGTVGTFQTLDSAKKLHELANSLNSLIAKFKI